MRVSFFILRFRYFQSSMALFFSIAFSRLIFNIFIINGFVVKCLQLLNIVFLLKEKAISSLFNLFIDL